MKLFTLGRPFHTQAGKHRNGSGSNASPATDGHAVFAYFKSGTLAALQLDGRVRWQTNLVERFGPDTLYWDEFLPLFEIGSDAVPYLVPTMLAELNRANVAARRGACLVLGGFGPVAKSTIPALTQALGDEEKGVRDNADRALRPIELSTNGPPAHLF